MYTGAFGASSFKKYVIIWFVSEAKPEFESTVI
jgi:hypothetical protein